MRQIADGVAIATSRYWQTNTGVIRTDAGVVMVDAGVLPSELQAIATASDGSIVAGVSTHEHWDHLLWSEALGADVPRFASAIAAEAAVANRVALLQRRGGRGDLGVAWDRDLFGRTIAHEPGVMDLGPGSPELIALPGHAPGQFGLWAPGAAVLFAGDTGSDIDPPALPADRAGVDTYLSTLDRMLDLVAEARVVVPGHGTPCDGAEAGRRLARDRRYVDAVLDVIDRALDVPAAIVAFAAAVEDPRLDSPGGRQLHRQNVTDLLKT